MKGDPLLPALAILGCVMLCAMFLIPWASIPSRTRRVAHRIGKRIMSWAASPCDCQHCWNALRILDDQEWARFVEQHELRTRKRTLS